MAILNSATPAGAGLANDSAAYIAGARSILQGKGYSDIWLASELEPITHYPPLLSLTLAVIGLMKIDPLRGVRILNILLFGMNTALMGLLGWRATRSRIAGIWLAAIFMLNASLLRVHVYALSEPLYLFLSLLCFLFIDLYFNDDFTGQPETFVKHQKQKMLWIMLAGAISGLAFLTRYSALALLPTFAITLFLLQGSWQTRIKSVVLYLAAALPLMAAWLVRNKLAAGNVTNRSFQFHPITAENIQPGFYNFAQFLLPIEDWQKTLIKSGWMQGILAVVGIVLFAWLVLQVWRICVRVQKRPGGTIGFTTVLYVFGYLGAVLFSMSFFDASTKFQPRILAPIYVSLMLLTAAAGAWLFRQRVAGCMLQGLILSLAVIALAFSAYGSQQSLAVLTQAGQGYASWKWHDSQVMASIGSLPPEMIIYTNTPPAVYLVTGRASRILPSPIDPVDNLPRGNYEQDLAQMRADLLAGKAVLALFDISSIEDALNMQPGADFVNGLVVLQKAQGDILYGRP